MSPFNHSPKSRFAWAPGLAAGALLVLSASVTEAEPLVSANAALAAAAPKRIEIAQADATPAPHPATYSEAQADRGKSRFEKDCIDCHGDDLKGGMNGGAPLRGLSFEQKFANGAPASGMFLFMSTQMPPNAPGRYSAETYADLMAYILKKNGFKSGAPLPSDIDALDNLTLEK